MAGEDSWVFDSLVCFLHGPIWNAPLQTFIEEKSLVFDPSLQPDETNPQVQQIHNEYKNLVDYMLGSFMEELQINPEQFELACMEGRNNQADNPFQFHQGLFQQIWAANDIKIFVRMMTQRNVELQLQALDLIEKSQLPLLQDGEEEILDDAKTENQTKVEDLIAKSVELELATPEATLTPEHDVNVDEVADKFERLNLFFEKNQKVNSDDIMSRQEYLKQQRDKIVEIKKKTRAKQLSDTVAQKVGPMGRPTSAQVAQKYLQSGGKGAEELLEQGEDTEESAALQLRKALAKRLRSEVVERK